MSIFCAHTTWCSCMTFVFTPHGIHAWHLCVRHLALIHYICVTSHGVHAWHLCVRHMALMHDICVYATWRSCIIFVCTPHGVHAWHLCVYQMVLMHDIKLFTVQFTSFKVCILNYCFSFVGVTFFLPHHENNLSICFSYLFWKVKRSDSLRGSKPENDSQNGSWSKASFTSWIIFLTNFVYVSSDEVSNANLAELLRFELGYKISVSSSETFRRASNCSFVNHCRLLLILRWSFSKAAKAVSRWTGRSDMHSETFPFCNARFKGWASSNTSRMIRMVAINSCLLIL